MAMNIGAKLAAARKNNGLTQEKLAEKLGVTPQAISTWERDENLPDLKNLLQLGSVLGITMNELLAEDPGDWKLRITDRQPLLDRAIEFAAVKHAGIPRKGGTIPYITHVIEAMEIVSRITEDEEIRAAAVLHDTLEDTETTKEELVRHFGQRVADLVAAESENKRKDQPEEETWWTRKKETIQHLSETATECRIIALGDKLSNIRAMYRDYQVLGDQLWERFNQKDPIMQGIYYGQLANVFGADETLRETQAYQEYVKLASELFSKEYEYDTEPAKDEETGLQIRAFYADAMKDLDGMGTAWCLILDRPENAAQEELQKMAMTLDAFMRDEHIGFGNVHLVITNNPKGGEVSWERTADGYAIHLCAESEKHWCQVAYQMGYAMMHCLIDHLGDKDQEGISWAEELVCEAATLELLFRLQERWDETPYHPYAEYVQNIQKYIEDNLSDKGTSALLRCRGRDELKTINAENRFDDRLDESHDLYREMEEGDLLKLAQIRKYEADDLLLYTHYWRDREEKSAAVDYLCRLQERIPGCDVPAGIHQEINLQDSQPTEAQKQTYGDMIRAMRPLPCEYIIFSFLDADKGEKEQIGLVFYQVTREKDGQIVAEIRLDTKDGRTMYRIHADDDQAIGTLKCILDQNAVPDLSSWENVSEEIFGIREMAPANEEDEFFPGISMTGFRNHLDKMLENPIFGIYFDQAPSTECQTLIGLQWYDSAFHSEASKEAIKIVEDDLSLTDWQYLKKHCGDKQREAYMQNRIRELQLKEKLALLTDIRNRPEEYQPLIDHAWQHFEKRNEFGDVNIGWNIGLLEGNRPCFTECWATDGITMLTCFVPTKGIEEKPEEELIAMLAETGIAAMKEDAGDRRPTVQRFTDGNGNEFFSVNYPVGDDEGTYLSEDSGEIFPFAELNRFNDKDDSDK